MDIAERARLAVARVPSPGLRSSMFGRHVVWSLLAVAAALMAALWWLAQHGTSLGPGTLLALLALTCVLLAVALRQLSSSRRARRTVDAYLSGDFESASRVYYEQLDDRWLLPAWRASAGVSLATIALMAGHAERAVVLLRAVEASGALLRSYDETLQTRIVLAMLALRRPAEARAVLASLLASPRSSLLRQQHVGIQLMVEALSGRLEVATGMAESFIDASRKPLAAALASTPGGAMQRAFGWLVVAYVWDRVAREASPERRADAEGRRAAALHLAGRVPTFAYRYLADAWPDFVRFADGAAPP